MMAIIGTLAFNFPVVLPLFVTRTFGGDDSTFTLLLSVLSVGSLTGALVTARRKAIALRHVVVARRRRSAWPCSLLAAGAHPRPGLPDRPGHGLRQHRVHDRLHRHRAGAGRSGRCGAGCSRSRPWSSSGSTPIGGPILGVVCDAFGARAGLVVGGRGRPRLRPVGGLMAGRRSLSAGRSRAPGERSTRPLAARGPALTRSPDSGAEPTQHYPRRRDRAPGDRGVAAARPLGQAADRLELRLAARWILSPPVRGCRASSCSCSSASGS